jgi:hypothetical protein
LLYNELLNGEADLANQILDAMELDHDRYRYYLDQALKASGQIEPLD